MEIGFEVITQPNQLDSLIAVHPGQESDNFPGKKTVYNNINTQSTIRPTLFILNHIELSFLLSFTLFLLAH